MILQLVLMAAQIPHQQGQLVGQHADMAAAAARNSMLMVLDTSVTFRSPTPRKKP